MSEKKPTTDFAGYYAPEKIGKSRRVTPEGFLVLEATPIARTGEQVYAAHELEGVEANGAGYIVVERPAEEVFREETLQSFEGKDFVIEHPPDGVDVANWKNHTVGHVQNVRRGEGIEDDLIIADIIVKDPVAIEYVNKHLPELSAGYNADYEPVEPGKAIQRNIIGNHVAGVKAGRAGARIAVRDHSTTPQEQAMSVKKPFWAAFRDSLGILGVRAEDITKVETDLKSCTLTQDNADASDALMQKLEGFGADMKAVKDWMAARDAEREEESKKREEAEKAAEDAKAKDAEAVSKEEGEMEASEETGDTLLEAESPGKVVNLGKTWCGNITGDAAPEPVLQAVVARAEILAPGIDKPTADSLRGNKGKVLAAFMRTALARHATSDSGKANIAAFNVAQDPIDKLAGERLVGVFNGVSQLARMRNNQKASLFATRRTGDFAAPSKSIKDINEGNAKFWANRGV